MNGAFFCLKIYGSLAQFGRAPHLHCGGYRFDPDVNPLTLGEVVMSHKVVDHQHYKKLGDVAQLVEQDTVDVKVEGSIPFVSVKRYYGVNNTTGRVPGTVSKQSNWYLKFADGKV